MEGQSNMEMNTELVCVMASIGYADGDDYFKGIDCLESLKDMIRFLRHEDLKICNIRRQMGHTKVLQNDLLPLLIHCAEDKELVDIVLRLLVNLTSAPDLCFNQNPDEDLNKTERKTFEMQIISYLQSYKEAFTDKSAMSTIGSHFARILQLDATEREEEDVLLLERILLLIRNLLFIPSNPEDEKRTDDDVTIHDQLLWNLHVNGIDDLLIYLSSSSEEGNWCMHALEIISHMFREQNAEELAKTNENRSRKEKQEDANKMKTILAREKAEKEKQIDVRGTRHSRFGGSFWIKNRKALNCDEDVVYHRPLQSTKNLTHDFDKRPERKRITRRPLQDVNKERRSTLSVRIFLKEFCMKFLEHGYNNLMYSVKSNLDAGRTQKHDETYYITVMRFFMTFNRVKSFRIEYVSRTFGIEAFNFIQNLTLRYLDIYSTAKVMKEKQRKMEYARRLKLAVSAYKELIMYVAIMAKGDDEDLQKAANVIQSNIFYTEEYRYLFISLLRSWNAVFQTRLYLKDVIESFHVYLKLFESFLKGKGKFFARSKGVTKRVKRRSKPQAQRCPIEITEEQAENLWQDTVSAELSSCLQGREGDIQYDDIVPFDPLSDIPADGQVTMALASIQRLLRCNQPGKAVAYLRASRECWVEEQKFGTANMSMEDEFMCLRGIYFMELPFDVLQQAEGKLGDEEIEEEIEEEEAEEIIPEQVTKTKEKQFDIQPFLKKLGTIKIVQPYCYLLKFYKENSAHTNHCIIKMLHRVAVDLKLNAMLFQLSVFITFKNILNEPKTEDNKEMRGFAKYILSTFFELYNRKPNIIVDLLICKDNIECYVLTEDEDFLRKARKKSKHEGIGKWTFEEEQELIDLYEKYQTQNDAIEKIVQDLKSRNRTAHQITNKLRRLRILEKPRKRRPNEWNEAETDELKRVFEEFKDTDDPIGNIMNSLSFSKAKKWVVARIVEIGLVNDKRALYKKRKKKSKTAETNEDDDDDDDGLMIDENEENEYVAENGIETGHNEAEDDDGNDDDDDDDDDDLPGSASFPEIIGRLVDLGFADQIEWVQGRLRRLANERDNVEEEQWQSVPLVPITEDHENAMDSKLFRRMLKRVGVSPPATEQESFWRISSSLSPAEMRSCVQDLNTKVNFNATRQKNRTNEPVQGEELSRNGDQETNKSNESDDDDDDDDDCFENFLSGHKNMESAITSTQNGEMGAGIDENNENMTGDSRNRNDDVSGNDYGDNDGVHDNNDDNVDTERNTLESTGSNHMNGIINNDNDIDMDDDGDIGDNDDDIDDYNDHNDEHDGVDDSDSETKISESTLSNGYQMNGNVHHDNDNDIDDDETQFEQEVEEVQKEVQETKTKKIPLKRDRQSAFNDDDDYDDNHDSGMNHTELSPNHEDLNRKEKKRRVINDEDNGDGEDEDIVKINGVSP